MNNTKNLINNIFNKKFTLIHGPCSLESEEQIDKIVKELKNVSPIFRAGIYKPRTSPDSFQGLGELGLNIIDKIKKENNDEILFTVEITDQKQITKEALLLIDIIQIGARNMQNYELLKAVGKTQKPILLKRGFGATVDELIASAKYIEKEGNNQIILCERGIRTFSNVSRFTLDLSAISYLQKKTSYPIFIDPSHAGGEREEVKKLAKAAYAYGCDGMIIEVHPNPDEALSDSEQQLDINDYLNLIKNFK